MYHILRNRLEYSDRKTSYHNKYIEFYLDKVIKFLMCLKQDQQSNQYIEMVNYFKKIELHSIDPYFQRMIMNHKTKLIDSIKVITELLTDVNETEEIKSKIHMWLRLYYTTGNKLLPWSIYDTYFHHIMGKLDEYFNLLRIYNEEFLELYPELISMIEKKF